MWEKVKLGDVCEVINGYAFKSSQYATTDGARVIRITNVQKGKVVDNDPKLYPFKLLKSLSNFEIFENDILMSLTGNVGRVGLFPKEMLPAYLNQRICKIKLNSDKLINQYLFHYLNSDNFEKEAINASGGAAQLNLSSNWVSSYELLLPPLPIQEKIAAILDKADELRRKDKDLQYKYDELAQAIFIDMFGDPVRNEKGWQVKKLGDLGYLKNGLNYGNNESGKELTVFGVGDFKSNWLFNDYRNLKTLNINNIPNKSFLLADGDILFVRSNGNKELIGRAILLKNINTVITYSGFCIKFTRTSFDINEYYLIRLLVNSKFKKYILNGGRGANIQNINQEILSTLNIPIPPIKLQEEFAKKIEIINQLKAKINTGKSEELFQSLLQKAFKGELVS